MNNRLLSIVIFICLYDVAGCRKSDPYSGPVIQDYMPLHTGHSIIYQLDSILYTHFGSVLEQHSYIVPTSYYTGFEVKMSIIAYQ